MKSRYVGFRVFGNEINCVIFLLFLRRSVDYVMLRNQQEQGLMCRGGLLWYRDVVVFPCRVQEKYEEVSF